MPSTLRAAALLFWCAGWALAGSLSYVGELSSGCFGPGNAPPLAVTQAPSAPGDNPVLLIVNSVGLYCQYAGDQIESPYGTTGQFPVAIKLSRFSAVAMAPNGLTGYFFSAPNLKLITYGITSEQIVQVSPYLLFLHNSVESMAVSQQGQVTMIADDLGYLVDPTTAVGTQIFAEDGGSASGEFNDAFYQSYGPNGLLYVLDYGNGRVQALDPANNYAPVVADSFNLATGVTTANMQFAIGSGGTFYFGDGAGGGTYYASNGTYLGAFSSPVDTSTPAVQPYISLDGTGHVFVFDSTGDHEFVDSSAAVPEPSSISLMLIGIAGAAIYRRRRGPRSHRAPR